MSTPRLHPHHPLPAPVVHAAFSIPQSRSHVLAGVQDAYWSDDEAENAECPLCLEEMEISDLNFKPCICGYQICRFCWFHIKENLNKRCPACRRIYTDDAVEFKPVAAQDHKRLTQQKKQRDRERKDLEVLGRRHLANVRVVQRNVVYVVGLGPRFAKEELISTLRSNEYFGQYGKITKILLVKRNSPGGGGPVVGLYITYYRREDAACAISAVDGSPSLGGGQGVMRASYGTTKYCMAFLRGVTCSDHSCMNLHEWGDERDFFSEDLTTSKHTMKATESRNRTVITKKGEEDAGLPRAASWAQKRSDNALPAVGSSSNTTISLPASNVTTTRRTRRTGTKKPYRTAVNAVATQARLPSDERNIQFGNYRGDRDREKNVEDAELHLVEDTTRTSNPMAKRMEAERKGIHLLKEEKVKRTVEAAKKMELKASQKLEEVKETDLKKKEEQTRKREDELRLDVEKFKEPPPHASSVTGSAISLFSTLLSGATTADLTGSIVRDSEYPAHGGGYADVYKGLLRQDEKDIKVAIKVIRAHIYTTVNQWKIAKRLRKEIHLWSCLQHPNVVPLLGTTMGFGSYPAMVCPWMNDGNLNHYLSDRKTELNLRKRLQILVDVVEGLSYLHSRPIIHGDLTTGNILMDGGTAHLSDFGLSNVMLEVRSASFMTSTVSGAARWTAPELLHLGTGMSEVSSVSKYSDIYSFGCVALQIISGRIPFGEIVSDIQVLMVLLKGTIPPRPHEPLLSDGFWEFIIPCWSKDPVRRPEIEKLRKKLQLLRSYCSEEDLSRNVLDANEIPDEGVLAQSFSSQNT